MNESRKQDMSYLFLSDITPAHENQLLYDPFAPNASCDDNKLYFSIKKDGILEPLHITSDGIILSGNRRYAAAQWLGLDKVPCIVHKEIIYNDLSADERLAVLARYNKQRDKNYAERLREVALEINPKEAYERLRKDRATKRHPIEENVSLGDYKKRARITTIAFLRAAQKAVNSEKAFWPLTVRRVHYLLLNDPPLRHDKKPKSTYQNNLSSYKALTNLLLRARLTGDIPHIAIEDETRPIRVLATYEDPVDYIAKETEDFLRYYARDLLRGQPHHIEILVEKNAIRKHVEMVADEYCIPCTTGRGYSSLTPRYKMVQRFKQSGKKQMILLILSDFDPDGEEIAASFIRSLRGDLEESNIIAHKVAISGADVRKHGLPSDMEAKIKSPNYNKFVARHGIHVAELDAAPVDLLQGKLRDAIESCLDMDLFQAELENEKEDSAYIAATKAAVLQALGKL